MSEQNKVDQAAYEAMRKAHAFCPSELSHLDKMRWMADYFLKNYSSQFPAPMPEQVAQAFGIEGLKKHTRSDGNFGLAEFYLAADVERLLITQSAQEVTQQAAPDMRDAYVGAREDLAIWKKRALEAEESCRRLTAVLNDENGPAFMGEPVVTQQAAKAERAELAEGEQVQLRNIQNVVRDLADFCFGSADASGQISLGAAHVALSNSLTAKDGLRMRLDPLPQRAALSPLSEPRIVELYRESFKAMADRLREPPKYVSPCVLDFARAIESEVARRFRAQGGNTNSNSPEFEGISGSDLAPTTSTVSASGADGSAT